ncbi:MAG: FAD-dependent monooxygenase, partial [Gemmatimonadaceae bacterium]
QRADGTEETTAVSYICGCDGAHSAVRSTLGLRFPGGTYDQLFYVADVEREIKAVDELEMCLGAKIFVLSLPVRSSGMHRLIGIVPQELSNKKDISWDDIRGKIEPLLSSRVKSVNWFASYRVHHRVAEKFRVGRAFLAGDAGHIHSPAGGQGMNTGIGDAINLGWKLAHVLQGRANESILDSYEDERIRFARTLVKSTDRGFTAVVGMGAVGSTIRKFVMPLIFNVGTRLSFARHAGFRLVSQIRITYRKCAFNIGKAGDVRGGDRLPWVQFALDANSSDNFEPLRSLDWQVHVYGKASKEIVSQCAELGVPLHQFVFNSMCKDVGLAEDALYLVRPDGHVGLASTQQPAHELDKYVDRFGLVFR